MKPLCSIGIDIGRVIISGDTDGSPSMFGQDFLGAPPVDDAFHTIARIVEQRGPECIHLVSKCGEAIAARSLAWLHHQDFFTRTGMHSSHVHFCRKRAEKRIHCDRLGIQLFIDDRFSVLEHLLHLPCLFLFNPDKAELSSYRPLAGNLPQIQCVPNWRAIAAELLV